MAEHPLTVRVVSPERTVFEGDASSVSAPGWDGRFGVLRGHAPMITLLGVGQVIVQVGSTARAFHVGGGLLKVEANQVTAITEFASEEEPSPELLEELKMAAVGLHAE